MQCILIKNKNTFEHTLYVFTFPAVVTEAGGGGSQISYVMVVLPFGVADQR